MKKKYTFILLIIISGISLFLTMNNIVSIFLPSIDTTPPSKIKNIDFSSGTDWISFKWDGPIESDFLHTKIKVNGSLVNVTNRNYIIIRNLNKSSLYEISLISVDKSGNINPVTLYVSTKAEPDIYAPAAATGLRSLEKGVDWIQVIWDLPLEGDFNHSRIFLNGSNVVNTSVHYVYLTNLTHSTVYNISIINVDKYGNENTTIYPFINKTLQTDDRPPFAIENPKYLTGSSWIYFTWNNPNSPDFSHLEIFLQDKFIGNYSAGEVNITGLLSGFFYELRAYSVDIYGNKNPVHYYVGISTMLEAYYDFQSNFVYLVIILLLCSLIAIILIINLRTSPRRIFENLKSLALLLKNRLSIKFNSSNEEINPLFSKGLILFLMISTISFTYNVIFSFSIFTFFMFFIWNILLIYFLFKMKIYSNIIFWGAVSFTFILISVIYLLKSEFMNIHYLFFGFLTMILYLFVPTLVNYFFKKDKDFITPSNKKQKNNYESHKNKEENNIKKEKKRLNKDSLSFWVNNNKKFLLNWLLVIISGVLLLILRSNNSFIGIIVNIFVVVFLFVIQSGYLLSRLFFKNINFIEKIGFILIFGLIYSILLSLVLYTASGIMNFWTINYSITYLIHFSLLIIFNLIIFIIDKKNLNEINFKERLDKFIPINDRSEEDRQLSKEFKFNLNIEKKYILGFFGILISSAILVFFIFSDINIELYSEVYTNYGSYLISNKIPTYDYALVLVLCMFNGIINIQVDYIWIFFKFLRIFILSMQITLIFILSFRIFKSQKLALFSTVLFSFNHYAIFFMISDQFNNIIGESIFFLIIILLIIWYQQFAEKDKNLFKNEFIESSKYNTIEGFERFNDYFRSSYSSFVFIILILSLLLFTHRSIIFLLVFIISIFALLFFIKESGKSISDKIIRKTIIVGCLTIIISILIIFNGFFRIIPIPQLIDYINRSYDMYRNITIVSELSFQYPALFFFSGWSLLIIFGTLIFGRNNLKSPLTGIMFLFFICVFILSKYYWFNIYLLEERINYLLSPYLAINSIIFLTSILLYFKLNEKKGNILLILFASIIITLNIIIILYLIPIY